MSLIESKIENWELVAPLIDVIDNLVSNAN